MARDVNVSITNFVLGTGPANTSMDIAVTWTANDGTPRSASRTGVTLAQVWTRPAITAQIKQEVIQDIVYKLVRYDIGLED